MKTEEGKTEMNISELERLIALRDEAAEELLRCIREASRIADNLDDYWRNLGVND